MADSYFKSLPLPKKLAEKIFFKEGDELNRKQSIENLSHINIFVGPNNSGKSLIDRELIKRSINFKSNSLHLQEKIKTALDKLLEYYSSQLKNTEFESNISELSDRKSFFSQNFLQNLPHIDSYTLKEDLRNLNNQISSIKMDDEGNPIIQDKLAEKLNELGIVDEMLKQKSKLIVYNIIKEELLDQEKFKKIYVPIVRGLRTIYKDSNFQQRIIKDYEFQDKVKVEIGDEIYKDVLQMKNTESPNRKQMKRFEKFLIDNFFNGDDIELTTFINHENQPKKLYIEIGGEKEKEIYNVGDGIQMIIAMTFPLFKYKQGIIVIEEPELSIHPGMQKKFMQFLIEHEYAKNFQFFICTHSNHILDAANESDHVSIFGIEKKRPEKEQAIDYEPDFVITNLRYRDRSILELLGVSNTSVYLSNFSIWVEGITDKLYINKYLQLYAEKKDKEKLREGVDYSFVFSGGDNIKYFDFLEKSIKNEEVDARKIAVKNLCGRAIVVVDGDGDGESKKTRKDELQKALSIRFIDLGNEEIGVTEIENLLTIDIISEVVHSYSTWSDVSVDEIRKKLEASDENILKIRIGSFIDNALKNLNKKGKRKKFSTGGENTTLRSGYKVEFSIKAIEAIELESKISYEALKLAEKIYNIISEQKH